MKLEGKVAIVSGGARGQGRSHCLALAREAADIVVADICHDLPYPTYPLATEEQLDQVVEEVKTLGRRALGVKVDVRKATEVEAMVDRTIEEFGQIDILVNNAGIGGLASVPEMTEEAWDTMLDTNLKGVWLCCKYVLPHMMEQNSGKIINIASVGGLKGMGWASHYSAAKHGLVGFTKSLALEAVYNNINVNVICPGTIFTDMIKGLADEMDMDYEDTMAELSSGHLMEDPIEPGDVSNAVVWLASEESRCLTGVVLTVDAGWMLR